jgi:thiol:disulfide interchange protein
MPLVTQRPLIPLKLLLGFVCSLSFSNVCFAIEDDELLPVEEAYIPTVTVSGDVVNLNFVVAPGYYLYKERTSLEAARPDEVVLAELELPEGEKKTDDFFGEMHVFHKDFAGSAKMSFPGPRPVLVAFRLKYQGCADIGVCYPPQTRTFAMDLASASGMATMPDPPLSGAPPAPTSPGSEMISGITDATPAPMMDAVPAATTDPLGLSPGATNPASPGLIAPGNALPEAQAFRAEALATDGQTVLVRISAPADYYLYRDQFKFTLNSAGVSLTPEFPPSQTIKDEHFGDVDVYFGGVDIALKLTRTTAAPANTTLDLAFQGCKKDSVCYPVMHRSVPVALPAATSLAAASGVAVTAIATPPIALQTPLAPSNTAMTRPADAEVLPQLLTPGIVLDAIARATGEASAKLAEAKPAGDVGLFLALLLALGGGVLLNLMPCVLPVLSLKVLGLVESGASIKTARAQAIWYTVGILASFFVLGVILLSFKSAGTALGWGFQLQNPLIVGLLAFLLIAMGLNMSGVVSFGHSFGNIGANLAQSNAKNPARSAFFNGVLACIVATPCTGPGMFTALGYGFTQSNFVAMLILLALGLGLALPFLLIGFIPALAQRLPRPGAWMDTLKSWLAFPLYLTAVWLLSVLGKQTGIDGMGYALAGAVFLAAGLWWWDKQRYSTADSTVLGKAFSLALVIGAFVILWSAAKLKNDTREVLAEGQVPYSVAALTELRAKGTPVFVDMTAAWCITCKVNEKNAINTYAVGQAMQQAGMVYMVGDYTNSDPVITEYLKSFSAVGVPLYVMYPKRAPNLSLEAAQPGAVN